MTDTLLSIAAAGNDVLIIGDYYNDKIAESVDYYLDDSYLQDSFITFNFTDPNLKADTNFVYNFHNRNFEPDKLSYIYLMKDLDLAYANEKFVKVSTPDSLILMAAIPFGDGRIFYHVKKDLFYNYSYRQNQMF